MSVKKASHTDSVVYIREALQSKRDYEEANHKPFDPKRTSSDGERSGV